MSPGEGTGKSVRAQLCTHVQSKSSAHFTCKLKCWDPTSTIQKKQKQKQTLVKEMRHVNEQIYKELRICRKLLQPTLVLKLPRRAS